MKKQTRLLIMVLVVTAGVATAATEYQWPSGTGDWLDTGWTTNGVGVIPTWDANADARLLGGTMNLTPASNPGATIGTVLIESASLNVSSDLSGTNLEVGYSGGNVATYNQTAGAVSMSGRSRIGVYTAGTTGTMTVSGGSFSTDALAIAWDSTATLNLNSGASVSITGASGGNTSGIGIYGGSTGIFNMNGGTFNAGSDDFHVGRSGDGTLYMTGGTFTAAKILIARWTDQQGLIDQSGGVMNLDALDLSSSGGTYTISGGSLDVQGNIWSAGGMFVVDGSGATSIDADNVLFWDDTFRVLLDENGSTRVDVADVAEITKLEVGTLAGFNGTVGSTYDIMWSGTGFQNSGGDIVLTDLDSEEFGWSIVSDGGTGEILQLTVIPEPATLGMVAFLGGAMLWIRRKFLI